MRTIHRAAASLLLLAFPGCATGPLDRPEAVEITKLPRLHRTVLIQLESKDAEQFGSQKDWEDTFVLVFEKLGVCAALLPAAGAEDADLTIGVTIRPSVPAEPEVDGRGAFLDFLAWSTLPLVPLWIPDVNLSPDLTVEVSGGKDQLGTGRASRVSTCYVERYPFLSWSTLGAVFVPPFIFASGDAEHSAAVMAETVRLDVAVLAAGMVKRYSLGGAELISGLSIDADLTLHYTPLAGLRRIRAAFEPAGPADESAQEDIVPLDWPDGKARTLRLSAPGPRGGQPPRLVRVEALGKRGAPLRYTVRVPDTNLPGEGTAARP